MTLKLSKLKRVPLRDIWKKEDKNFTKWLAEEDSLEELGDALGMRLEWDETERKIGSFSADIVCKNIFDNSLVVIENQLERTDHDHLGKVITYGAGLDALTMIWIASKFRKEHRDALKWLNKNMDDKFQFFGLEVEALRIGDSLPAPRFNLIVHPKGWHKPKSRGKQKTGKVGDSPLRELQKRYWETLVSYCRDTDFKLDLRKPYPQNWHAFAIGHSYIHIGAIMDTRKKTIGVELCMENTNSKKFFTLLEKEKAQIEKEIDAELEWRNLEKNKSTKIIQFKNANPKSWLEWKEQHVWLKKTIEKFDSVFTHRLDAIASKNKN